MAKVVIESDDLLAGSYELDLAAGFTHRELHLIKVETGLRAGDLEDAITNADTDLLVALALIALRRAGKPFPAEMLWDMEAGKITLDVSDEEGDALTPAETPPGQSAAADEKPADGKTSTAVSRPPSDLIPEPILPSSTGSRG